MTAITWLQLCVCRSSRNCAAAAAAAAPAARDLQLREWQLHHQGGLEQPLKRVLKWGHRKRGLEWRRNRRVLARSATCATAIATNVSDCATSLAHAKIKMATISQTRLSRPKPDQAKRNGEGERESCMTRRRDKSLVPTDQQTNSKTEQIRKTWSHQ